MNVTVGKAFCLCFNKSDVPFVNIKEKNILKRAILNYFWLMLQYLFSCIRNSFVEKKMYFSLMQEKKLFLLL